MLIKNNNFRNFKRLQQLARFYLKNKHFDCSYKCHELSFKNGFSVKTCAINGILRTFRSERHSFTSDKNTMVFIALYQTTKITK